MPAQCEVTGILQIHPTTRCNLACAHCYSNSSPSASAALPVEPVCRLIEEAAALGFGVVSLSGGEPLVYDGLDDVLATAWRCGSRVNLVSNGLLIRSPRYERHAGRFSIVALSLDGLEGRHNTIRGNPKSFAHVRAAAASLHSAGQRFGVIHTLCSESLDEVEEIAELVSEWGASLLQLHPLEPTDRDLRDVRMTPLSAAERLDSYLLAEYIASQLPHMHVQLDLVHRDIARCLPGALHGAPLREPQPPRELVLEESGRLVPLTYGLPPAFAVTDILSASLAEVWEDYLGSTWRVLRRHLRLAALEVARGRHGEVVPWHDLLRSRLRSQRLLETQLSHESVAA